MLLKLNTLKKIILGIFLLSLSCTKKVENSNPVINGSTIKSICSDTVAISYSKTIQPILNQHCIKCHDASTSQNFTNYNGTLPFAKAGILENCVTGTNGEILMPPTRSSTMDSCSIKQIHYWIKQGCKNN